MGLSAREKEGCRSTLDHLDTSDLLSLYRTVVKSTTTVRNRAALIEEIMEHSQSATELLNRKRVYKEIIMKYLNSENLFMPMNSTKFEIIQKAIEHWQEPPDASGESSAKIPSRGSSSPKTPPQKSQKPCKPGEATKPSASTNTSQNNPVTVNFKAAGHLTISGSTQNTVDLSQLIFQLTSLSINSNREDQFPAPQPDASGESSANIPSIGPSSPKTPPQKSQKACKPGEATKPSASTNTSQLDTSANTPSKATSLAKKAPQKSKNVCRPEETRKQSASAAIDQNDTSASTSGRGASLTTKAPQKKQKACRPKEIRKKSASTTTSQLDTSSNSSSTVAKGISFPKKPRQKTQKAHQTEGSSNTPKSTSVRGLQAVEGGVHEVKSEYEDNESTESDRCISNKDFHCSSSSSWEDDEYPSVSALTMKDEAIQTPVLQENTNEISQSSSVQGTMPEP